jgi:protein SCO1/2
MAWSGTRQTELGLNLPANCSKASAMRRWLSRFRILALLVAALPLAACSQRKLARDDIGIAGMVPPLAFHMTDVNLGRPVTARTFRGKVTLLYFGYTQCPDVCPDTLAKMDKIFARLGRLSDRVSFLFVTVDPYRDKPPVLKAYTALFGPRIVGLRGNANQLFRLARRYRVVFTVHRSKNPADYLVTHSSAIYVFGQNGQAQFLISGLGISQHPDIAGITDDLRQLILHPPHRTLLERLASLA